MVIVGFYYKFWGMLIRSYEFFIVWVYDVFFGWWINFEYVEEWIFGKRLIVLVIENYVYFYVGFWIFVMMYKYR